MSLQFVVGGSGSGKTSYVYEKVIAASLKAPNQRYFIVVPEQFTMQTQKDIISAHPYHGTMNIDMVSFQRLAFHVFEELAVEYLEILDDTGKSMILRKVAAAVRGQLKLYRGHLSQNGFISELKSLISEFYQYGITPKKLTEMANEADTPLFKQKLMDLAVIFSEFKTYMEGDYITSEELLDVFCRRIPESKLIRGSVIALDNFTGFTPVQYRILELFMVHAKQVIVTVTMDAEVNPYRVKGIQNLFYMSSQMMKKLSELAKNNGVDQKQDVLLERGRTHRFIKDSELDWLERRLFRYGTEPVGIISRSGQIVLSHAEKPSKEAAAVVHQIRRLVQKEGFRYRDIAVVTGDLAGYGRELCHQFEEHGIPYFLDDKKSILENPLVELIRSALEVLQKNFSYESVFRYLRTGLVTERREMVDKTENYVLALGIRGYSGWSREWTRYSRFGKHLNLNELNEFRQEVLRPLEAMREAASAEGVTVRQLTEALRQFLTVQCVEDKLKKREEYFEENGLYSLVKEYKQVYELTISLLERMDALLGDEKISRREFAELLDAGFEEIHVGVIPAVVDRVVVGDLTRTRLSHIRALFLMGVNDGIIPKRSDDGGLLSDREREFFGEHQVELAPTMRENSFIQRFYLYLTMTKPSEYLFLSYSDMTMDGKGCRPSYLIGELQRLFSYLTPEAASAQGEVYSVAEAKERLTEGLKNYGICGKQPDFQELCRWFLTEDACREDMERMVDAAFYAYEDKGIGRAAARALYGRILSGSVTRLELYASCAYAHFLRYGLELLERERYEVAAVDLGNLFHDSIERCFKKVQDEGRDWREVTAKERKKLVHECVEAATEEYGNTIMLSSARNAWLAGRVEKMTDRTVWALQEQIKKGDFEPAGFEVTFSAVDNLKAMKIPLSQDEALYLKGRIDRLDVCEDGDTLFVKIIDYKSGSTTFHLTDLYYGLQLQLVVYMDAVMELQQKRFPDKKVVPAGIFYYNINDPVIDKEEELSGEEIDSRILRKLRMSGLVNSSLTAIQHLDRTIEKESEIIPVAMKDGLIQEAKSSVAGEERFAALQSYVHRRLTSAGGEILDGNIAVSPCRQGTKTACDYCPYHAVCGFEGKLPGYEFRRLKPLKAEKIWEEIVVPKKEM